SASSASTIVLCSAPKYRNTAALSMALALPHGAIADVRAVLRALETDLLHGFVGPGAGDAHRVAQRRDAQHASAARQELLAGEASPRVENPAFRRGRRHAFDAVSAARLFRVAVRGEHHTQGGAPVPLGSGAVEPAFHRALDELEQIRSQP